MKILPWSSLLLLASCSMGTLPESRGPCCTPESTDRLTIETASPWLAPDSRQVDLAALMIHATDQHGTVIPWRQSLAKPTVVAFFYSRCKNATKCAATVQNLARLRTLLHERGMASSTNVWGISYEPEYDSPPRLAAFGAGHGLRWPDDGVKLLATTRSDLHALIGTLDVPVNFNTSWVTLHGNALYLLDGAGRLVRSYRTLMWEPEQVAADLARLTTED